MVEREAPQTGVRKLGPLRWIAVIAFGLLFIFGVVLFVHLASFSTSVAERPRSGDLLEVEGEPCSRSGSTETHPSVVDLAHASPCRAAGILDAFERSGTTNDARDAVNWDFVFIPVYVTLLIWAGSLQLRSVRMRLAAQVVIVMAATAGVIDLFETWRLHELLSGSLDDGALTRGWVSSMSYAAHFKWPLIGASGLFAGFSAANWVYWRRHSPRRIPPPEASNPVIVAENARIPYIDPPVPLGFWKRLGNWWLGQPSEPGIPPPLPAKRAPEPPSVGVCCSGGGVRSAAFNLGALQALQTAGRLQRADFLAAVSGGAYIASALAVTVTRSEQEARRKGKSPTVTPAAPPFVRGMPEEAYLRNHSSYLAPGIGGKAMLAWQVLRGLAINLAIVFLLLVVVGLPAGWLIADGVHPAGIPKNSRVLLPRAGDADGNDVGYEVRIAEGSQISLSKNSKSALEPGSAVLVRNGSLVLVGGQPVVVDRADRAAKSGRVVLGAFSTVPLEIGKCDPAVAACGPDKSARIVELSEGTARALPGQTVTLASGEKEKVGELDAVTFAKGSALVVNRAVELRISEKASLDLATGSVTDRCGERRCVDHGVTAASWGIVGGLAGLGLLLTLISGLFRTREDWTVGLDTWSGRWLFVGSFAFVALVALPESVEWLRDAWGTPALDLSRVSIGGVLSVALAVLLDFTGARAARAGVVATGTGLIDKAKSAASDAGPAVRSAITSLAGALIAPVAILAGLLAIVVWGTLAGIGVEQATWVFSSIVALTFIWVTGDLTRWSMHPFYKRRLASAFALERVRDDKGVVRAQPVRYDRILRLSEVEHGVKPVVLKPELVVCAAANISDQGAAPPGRPVSTFTFSETHIGGGWLGLLTPKEFEDAADGTYARDVSLSAAVAISGAAISPAMGKIGKRRFSFLLGLANVRLGVWLPNPLYARRKQEEVRATLDQPEQAVVPTQDALSAELPKVWTFSSIARPDYLIREMLGRTSYRNPFVYVTDGGHFENLGLVELLRRGCTDVFCFDASGGDVDSFATLGQAIAIARSELGVEILINPKPPKKEDGDKKPDAPHGTARGTKRPEVPEGIHIGTIRYADSTKPDGRFVFARAVVTPESPWDVRAYQERDPKFPTHATLDQLYTDEKFEAYRALGYFMATQTMPAMDGKFDPPKPRRPRKRTRTATRRSGGSTSRARKR